MQMCHHIEETNDTYAFVRSDAFEFVRGWHGVVIAYHAYPFYDLLMQLMTNQHL